MQQHQLRLQLRQHKNKNPLLCPSLPLPLLLLVPLLLLLMLLWRQPVSSLRQSPYLLGALLQQEQPQLWLLLLVVLHPVLL